MQCKYCGFANGEDDHRCLRCGRRMAGVVVAAPAGYSSGANALALAPAPGLDTLEFGARDTQEFTPLQARGAPVQTRRASGDEGRQPALFPSTPGQKVIPFDELQRHLAGRAAPPQPAPAGPPTSQASSSVPAAPTPAARSHSQRPSRGAHGSDPAQTNFDFVPSAPAQRILKTDVPAQIYCEQPVATPIHRFVAGAMDAAMILLGFGVFVALASLVGASFGEGKLFWATLGMSFVLLALFYGLMWAMAGRVTAGMHWTHLQLITFDGFPVDRRSRAVRFLTTWLSVCSGGLGLLWAVADEENLTWHDHISKTFPTFGETSQSFVKQRR